VFPHEVRSSLGAINNAAQVLGILLGATSAGNKARLMIGRQVSRMTHLVDDLGEESPLAGAELPLISGRVDLRVVVKHAIETVESDLRSRNHRLTTSLPHTPMWLSAILTAWSKCGGISRVSAAKYTDDGGDISLCMHVSQERIHRTLTHDLRKHG
jgi:signal transduction histidine kinase